MKKIKTALISVFHKDGIEDLLQVLSENDVEILSTGGTKSFIENLGYQVRSVEDLTSYPSILGGRVKTLHPKIFGGILARRDVNEDIAQLETYEIPEVDLVVVDLYPFEETLRGTDDESAIIEKIDIGGIALIRATAKNFKDTVILSHRNQYATFIEMMSVQVCATTLEQRKTLAAEAFQVSSHYDSAIYNYFVQDEEEAKALKVSYGEGTTLRYGENPHQQGKFFGDLSEVFDQVNGKSISYNNLVDIDAAMHLIKEFEETTFVVIKHTNACGVASRSSVLQAWKDALAGDPVSAFGGVLITNANIDLACAEEINKLFFEVLIAPSFDEDALALLSSKKNRILLIQKMKTFSDHQYKTILNGVIYQDMDNKTESESDLKLVTTRKASTGELKDLVFASKIAKHLKSNTIVLAKNQQLLSMGCGQTSRVDALQQAIVKASHFNFDLKGSVMASDAFFPFPDCVEIADKAGVTCVVQPGGSIRDKDSIAYCENNNMSMVLTGTRHFKH